MVVIASVTEKEMSQYIMQCLSAKNEMMNYHTLHKPCVNEHDCHQGDGDCQNHSHDNTTCYETNLDRRGTSNCSNSEGKGIRNPMFLHDAFYRCIILSCIGCIVCTASTIIVITSN